jgi:hypothetical protein
MTKPKPHAKRGRRWPPKPITSPAPASRRGRPHVPLRQHPRRYDMAYFDAFKWMLGGERLSATFTANTDLRNVFPKPEDFNRPADRLRNLARFHSTPDDRVWRKAMCEAILLALCSPTRSGFMHRADLAEIRARDVLTLGASVGETEWVRRELLPLIREDGALAWIRANKKRRPN